MKIKLIFLIVFFLAILVGCSSSSSCNDSKPTSQWHNCSGTYVQKGIKTYSGEWKHGEQNGQGTLTFANGDQYVGEFKNGKYLCK